MSKEKPFILPYPEMITPTLIGALTILTGWVLAIREEYPWYATVSFAAIGLINWVIARDKYFCSAYALAITFNLLGIFAVVIWLIWSTQEVISLLGALLPAPLRDLFADLLGRASEMVRTPGQ